MKLKNGNQKKKPEENKLTQFLKASSRALAKIRDFYIRSLTECSNNLDHGMSVAGPTGPVTGNLPRTFSVSSTGSSHGSDDYRELVRAASTRGLMKKVEPQLQQKVTGKLPVAGADSMARSRSVAIGRIDEEKTYECEEDERVNVNNVCLRSRSYAVHTRKTLY